MSARDRSVQAKLFRAAFSCCLFVPVLSLAGQDSTTFRISAYVEAYYAYDLARPANGERPYFLYNHKRHNTASINLALLSLDVERRKARAAVGLMVGDYAKFNLAAEPDLLRNIYEAHVGIKLSSGHDLWLDAGVLPSHIGAEGAIGIDQLTLTRSLVAENSPYYEAGVRVQYKPNARWALAGLLLNGWQQIVRTPGNSRLAFGTQVQRKNEAGTTLNWSTFVGSMGPDSAAEWRVYNNLYAVMESDAYAMSLGLDVGMQESSMADENWDGWLTLVAIAKGRFGKKWWGVGRIEYFMDDRGVVTNGLTTLGASLGVDLRIDPNAVWRVEGRLLGGADDPFLDAAGNASPTNMAVTTSICVRF